MATTTPNAMTARQSRDIERTRQLTEWHVAVATEIGARISNGAATSDVLLAALVQAVATNYATMMANP